MLKFKTLCAVLAYLSSNLLNEVGFSLFRYFEVGLHVCDIVVKKFTFAISSPDEFLFVDGTSPAIRLRTVIRYRNDVATTLPLEVFIQRHFVADFFSTKVEFYWHKQRYRVFVAPFGGLRGNVHGSSMARWKARGRLPIGAN